MKLITLMLLGLIISTPAIGQELKTKKKSTDFYQEIYTVDKKSKLKQGSYIKLNINSKDTLVIGEYRNNKKVDVWKFFSINNKLYLKYDYANNVAEFSHNKYAKTDSIQIRNGNTFIKSRVDNPPFFIGYDGEEKLIMNENFLPPSSFFEKGLSGMLMASFVVNKTGEIEDITIENSYSDEINPTIEKSIKSTNRKWFPAKIDGNSIDSKMYIVYNVTFTKNPNYKLEQKYLDKPDLIVIDILFFGVDREIKRYGN